MNKVLKKHWIAFFIIIFFILGELVFQFNFLNITTVIFNLFNIPNTTIFPARTVAILNMLIPLFLMHGYLHEPLTEYGFHLKKIHIQIISGVILAFIILFLTYSSFPGTWLSTVIKHLMGQFSVDCFGTLGGIVGTLLFAISEEIVFRGFLLTFFNKLFKNSMISILFCAILFGLIHYPIGHNLNQVIFSTIIGFIYGYLRVKEPEKFTLFSLSLAHCLNNIFVEILLLYPS